MIAGIVPLLKNRSFRYALLRETLMFLFCFIILMLFSFFGVFEFIYSFLHISSTQYDNLAVGIPPAIMAVTVFIECTVINVVLIVRILIKRKKEE